MPLREDQIVRYGRQILLREVGGKGQERLLTTSVLAGSGGAGMGTATAYLVASGVTVLPAEGRLDSHEAGFLVASADAGSSAADAVRRAIQDANPDATRPVESRVWLAEAPTPIPETPLARVLMGGTPAGAAIVFGWSAGDGDVLRKNAPSHPVPIELADEVGALAALIVQQGVLGIRRGAGRVEIERAGDVQLAAGS
jgi:molybdopterin-synthase adenylyltransferase